MSYVHREPTDEELAELRLRMRANGQPRVWISQAEAAAHVARLARDAAERDQLRVRVGVLTEALTAIGRAFPTLPESLSGAQKLTIANAHHTLAAGTAPTEETP